MQMNSLPHWRIVPWVDTAVREWHRGSPAIHDYCRQVNTYDGYDTFCKQEVDERPVERRDSSEQTTLERMGEEPFGITIFYFTAVFIRPTEPRP